MPWTRQATLRSENTILQRGTVMCAIGIDRMYLVVDFDQEDLSALDTIYLHLDFVQLLQIELV